MSSDSENVKRWRANTKKKLIEAFGGSCNKCGYDLCPDALDLHHRDEKEKSFGLGSAMARPRKWSLIVEEAKKCVLLCCRCHRELHAGCWDLSKIGIVTPVFAEETELQPTGICPICETAVYGTITCSRSCAAVKRAKIAWPNKHELVELKKRMNRVKIAEMFGVSEMAVRKREKKYGIYSPVVKSRITRSC